MSGDTAERIAKVWHRAIADQYPVSGTESAEWASIPLLVRTPWVRAADHLLAAGAILPGPNLPPLAESEEQGR